MAKEECCILVDFAEGVWIVKEEKPQQEYFVVYCA